MNILFVTEPLGSLLADVDATVGRWPRTAPCVTSAHSARTSPASPSA
jgi:hypothetical protein